MRYTYREDPSLPENTVCASMKTAQLFQLEIPGASFTVIEDDSMQDDVVMFSSDMYQLVLKYWSEVDRQHRPHTQGAD